MKKSTILLVERDSALRRHIASVLTPKKFSVIESTDPGYVLQLLRLKQCPDLFLVNGSVNSPEDGLQVARLLSDGRPRIPVIMLAMQSSEALLLAALRAGVADYLKLPCADDSLLGSVERVLSSARRSQEETLPFADALPTEPRRSSSSKAKVPLLIGQSPAMRQIKTYLDKVACSDSNTLITGETGTGKELVAALVHQLSRRRQRPFIGMNCAAIPDSLLESELFGHERGAFTGAHVMKEGALELGNGGTVFFDEIGDMSPYTQAKILRVIESKEIRRLGGKRSIPLDVRFIAATNRDLERLMAEEKFRPDLYFRLNVANVQLPPLRERKEDLLALCAHYIEEMNQQFGLAVEGFSEEAFSALLHYSWPGNIRELKNLIEAIFINQPAKQIAYADLPEHFRRRCLEAAGLPQDERDRLLGALFATQWNKRQAAQQLHWSRMTLYRKLRKYHISHSKQQSVASVMEPEGQ